MSLTKEYPGPLGMRSKPVITGLDRVGSGRQRVFNGDFR
jgi:hypothetical protein